MTRSQRGGSKITWQDQAEKDIIAEKNIEKGQLILPEGKEESIMAGKTAVSCETCTYYTFDEDYEEYVCDMDMDEDEYIRLISDSHYECPYYRNGDDYRIVRKQM